MKHTHQNDQNCLACAVHETICLPDTDLPRVVIIGGGFAGLALIEKLKNKNVQVVLIDRNNFHQFQPLLYQVATSGLEPDNILFPFRKQISGFKNIIYRMANVLEIQTASNMVLTDKGSVAYDYLVFATGTTSNFFGMTQVEQYSLGLKDIRDALNIRHSMLQNLEQAAITCDPQEQDALTNFVIVGAGPAGVEMAGSLAEFCKYILPKDYPEYSSSTMKIYLVEAAGKVLPMMSEKASSRALQYLKQLNVNVLLNETVAQYDGRSVSTKSKQTIPARNLVWTAGVKGQFPKGLGKQSHTANSNRLLVDQYLKLTGYENIFAMGDVAALISDKYPRGHPQVAQVAIQQGKYLGKALLSILHKKPVQPFSYKDKGSLATVGKQKAVADIGRFRFAGYATWLLWSLVHIMSIIGIKNKLLIGLNWMLSYFSYEKSNRLIITNKD